jgi:phage recombination protein Bet
VATELAALPDWSSKVDLVKRMVARDCTDDEFELFLYTARRTGLDPLARQLYAVKRSGKMAIQTGIDGYRLIADRTGKLAGISDPIHTEAEGAKYPLTASVTVRKLLEGGIIADFTATARWGEYNAGGPMWQKMPYLMLGKCAEALALRKAFPADLSGVYTSEEMQQADSAAQGEAVYAEVARQQRQAPIGGTFEQATGDERLPPELDWSYNAKTGILICRVVDAEKRTGKGANPKDYIVVKLNGKADGKDAAFCWHASRQATLLGAHGKVVKLEVALTKDGKFLNIENVLEVDGQKIEKDEPSAEFQAQLIASELGMDAEELNELYTRVCKGYWPQALAMLKQRQDDLEAEQQEVAANE